MNSGEALNRAHRGKSWIIVPFRFSRCYRSFRPHNICYGGLCSFFGCQKRQWAVYCDNCPHRRQLNTQNDQPECHNAYPALSIIQPGGLITKNQSRQWLAIITYYRSLLQPVRGRLEFSQTDTGGRILVPTCHTAVRFWEVPITDGYHPYFPCPSNKNTGKCSCKDFLNVYICATKLQNFCGSPGEKVSFLFEGITNCWLNTEGNGSLAEPSRYYSCNQCRKGPL